MDAQHNAVVQTLARYGLPFVVLVFYVTASLSFAFTPDNTFISLQFTRGDLGSSVGSAGTPAPLWLGLVKLGSFSGLDLLLVAKVFSLVFACTAVIATFLLGSEVTGNRLLGLMAALTTAMTVWLLRAAPTGGALPLVVTLVLMTLFFLQRNEYVLAAILAGMCFLLFWQAAGLAVLVMVDVILNSIHKMRGVKMAASLLLVIVGIPFPWVLAAGYFGLDPLPILLVDRATGMIPDIYAAIAFVAPFAIAAAGFLRSGKKHGSIGPDVLLNITPVLWMISMLVMGVLSNLAFLWIALPIATIYAFRAVNIFFASSMGERSVYQLSVILGAVILLLNQASYAFSLRPEMARNIEEVKHLMEIGAWLSLNAADDAVIVSDHNGTVGYYAHRAVNRIEEAGISEADYVVTGTPLREGFVRIFTPAESGGLSTMSDDGQPFALWKSTRSR